MERRSRNWRGAVQVRLTVPTDATYSVNLAAIRPEDVHVDAGRRLLLVLMPEPRVEDVTPLLPELKAEDTFKHARFRHYDADASRELQNAILKEDYQRAARKEGEAHLPQVRERARQAVQEMLRMLLGPNCPGLRIEVE
jgi:hypothetical protein